MIINVSNLKIELNNLKSLLEDYENICLNMYNEFSASSFFWYDEKSKKFFNDLSKEKIKMNTKFNELSDIADIYNYIIKSYEKFGNNIQCELNSRNEIVNSIDNYRNKVNSIINKYNNLDLRYCNEVYNRIMNEKNELLSVSNEADELYNKVNNFFNEMEAIDKEISLRISRIQIEIINENLINEYV